MLGLVAQHGAGHERARGGAGHDQHADARVVADFRARVEQRLQRTGVDDRPGEGEPCRVLLDADDAVSGRHACRP